MNPARSAANDVPATTVIEATTADVDERSPFADFSVWMDEQLYDLEQRFWSYSTYSSLRRDSSR